MFVIFHHYRRLLLNSHFLHKVSLLSGRPYFGALVDTFHDICGGIRIHPFIRNPYQPSLYPYIYFIRCLKHSMHKDGNLYPLSCFPSFLCFSSISWLLHHIIRVGVLIILWRHELISVRYFGGPKSTNVSNPLSEYIVIIK